MKIQAVDREGKTHLLEWGPGQSLMEILRDENLVLASCNGHAICGTCHVFVAADSFAKLPAQSDDETALFQQADNFRKDASRLACQIMFAEELEGLRVVMAP